MTPIMKGTSVVNISSLISSQKLKWTERASWRQGNKEYKNLDPQKGVSKNIQFYDDKEFF